MKYLDTDRYWRGARFEPRDWQAEALPDAVDSIRSGEWNVIRAVMGAGKSIHIAEVCHVCRPGRGETIVVTAPTRKLVRDLSASIAERVGPYSVGRYYSDSKDTANPIIVACINSAPNLAEELRDQGDRVVLWIADEAHRTECDTGIAFARIAEPERAIGYTATPWRSDTSEELSLWADLIHDYGPSEALADGVVVPWKVRHWHGRQCSINEASTEMILEVLDEDLGPGVVNAITIDDAEDFADHLVENGVRARAIHSELSDGAQDDLLKGLERGLFDCLVHVSLLQEGVNMPWLMWGCLRRPVKSKVRFPQEVGRFLRSHPGKDSCVILDPQSLFETMGLKYEAVLAGSLEEPDEPPPVRRVLEETEALVGAPGEKLTANARTLDALSSYLRQLVLAGDAAGICEASVSSRRWRRDKASEKQRRAIWSKRWILNPYVMPQMPLEHREAIGQAIHHRDDLSKGSASDLLAVLFGLADRREWNDLLEDMADSPY